MHLKYGELKRRLFANTPAMLVEIGAGSGTNLRYFSPGTHLVAIEPNRQAHATLRARAQAFGLTLELHGSPAEQIDLPSASVDFVIGTLVFCSVQDPAKVIAEVRRVLRPGGRFACLEHVCAPLGSKTYRVQQFMREPWKWAFEGCDLCRNTSLTLRAAGFAQIDIIPFELPLYLGPVRYHITAVCVN